MDDSDAWNCWVYLLSGPVGNIWSQTPQDQDHGGNWWLLQDETSDHKYQGWNCG